MASGVKRNAPCADLSSRAWRDSLRSYLPLDLPPSHAGGRHLVAIRAPFHRSHIDCCRGLASLHRFLAMCAVSVTLIEAVRLAFAERGAQGSVVAGISLGGFVTLLHHLTYGSASRYVPLMAGPDLSHAMLSTPCRGLLAPQALAQPDHLRACLDFRQTFQDSDTRRILPLLVARHDVWMPCAHHQAAYAAAGVPVTLIDRGHMTGSWAFAGLRAHLLSVLHTLREAELAGAGSARRIATRCPLGAASPVCPSRPQRRPQGADRASDCIEEVARGAAGD